MQTILFANRNYSQLSILANNVINQYLSKHPNIKSSWLTTEERCDIFQDALCALYGTKSAYDPTRAKQSTWFCTIVLNKFKDHLKSYNPSESLEYENEDGDTVEIAALAGRNTVEDEVIGREEECQMDAFLSAKSPVDQTIMSLDMAGYKASEIAARLGLAPSVVSVRLCRLKKDCPVRPDRVAGQMLIGRRTIAKVA